LRACLASALLLFALTSPVHAFEWSGKRVEIAKGLDSPAPRDRIAAIRALALFPAEPEVLALIRRGLTDDSSLVRLAAIDVLAELGAESEEAALHPFLADADPSTRATAVRALGKIGGPDSVDPLIRTLGDPDPAVRRASIESLARVDPDRARVPIASLLDDTEEEVVLASVNALARIGGPTAVFPLLEKVKSPSLKTQVAAVTGLGLLGDARAALPLAALLDEGHPEVRAAAVVALGELRDPLATPHLVGALWRNQHGTLAGPILRALGQIGDPKAVPALLQILRFSKHRQLAARALEDTGPPAVEPLLAAMQRDGDAGFRQICLEVLQVILEERPPETVRLVINEHVLALWGRADIAPDALVGPLVAGRDPTAGLILAHHVRDLGSNPSPEAAGTRRRILKGLSQWDDGVAATPLLQAWPDLPRNERSLAIRALGASRSPKAVRLLAHELRGDDETTRIEAARALSRIDDAAAAKALLEQLDDPSDSLLHEIGIGLGQNRTANLSQELIRRLPASRGAARQAVLMALGDHYRRAGDAGIARALWKVIDDDSASRTRALDVLGARPDAELVRRAGPMYDAAPVSLKRKLVQVLGDAGGGEEVLLRATAGSDPILQAEAAWALRSVRTPRSRLRLLELLVDPSPMVRVNASASLASHGEQGGPTAELERAAATASGPVRSNLLLGLARAGSKNPARARVAAWARRDADPLVAESAVRILVARGTPEDLTTASRIFKRARPGGHREAMARALGKAPPGDPGEGWVRFLFTDGPERLPAQRVLVILPDGIVVAKHSDDVGEVRLENLPRGLCRLRFLDDTFSGP
jgi:HEAT repeat protein